MADTLRIVTVESGGGEGTLLGTLRFDGETITADTKIAVDTTNMLRRRSRLTDAKLWVFLSDRGWSNGAVMIAQ